MAGDIRPSRANTFFTTPPFAVDLGRQCEAAAGRFRAGAQGLRLFATQDGVASNALLLLVERYPVPMPAELTK
jgi:hypothetical protein